jgi:hypothetical protein
MIHTCWVPGIRMPKQGAWAPTTAVITAFTGAVSNLSTVKVGSSPPAMAAWASREGEFAPFALLAGG